MKTKTWKNYYIWNGSKQNPQFWSDISGWTTLQQATVCTPYDRDLRGFEVSMMKAEWLKDIEAIGLMETGKLTYRS